MLTMCPKCGSVHHDTKENARSPIPVDRYCAKCWKEFWDGSQDQETEVTSLFVDIGGEG